MSLNERNHFDISASRTNFLCAHYRLLAIIAAFDEDIWLERLHDFQRRVFVKNYYKINSFQRRQNIRAVGLRSHRAIRTLVEPTHGRIAVDADDERVAEPAGGGQQVNVTGM